MGDVQRPRSCNERAARVSTPKIHLIGNAHLDPAWMWRMDEGLAAFRATCRSALDRIREFPGFIFTCSSAAHYDFVERTDLKLFSEIQEAVRNGRWSVVGGWWVEPDCNLPSGESFVRQALLGQRYFESRFGKIATVGYNVDSFGHNANLPQLLRKAGLTSYVFMRPQQEEKELSTALFEWEAPSGDRVTTYRLPLHYSNHGQSTREKLEVLPQIEQYDASYDWMIFFGVGDHGGGPTIVELKEIERMREMRGDLELSDPEQFFANIEKDRLPVIHGEMQPHAIGCYSAHSEIKQLHRRAERALQQAERAQVLAQMHGISVTGRAQIEQAWKNVLFCEFHDLLGGVAIREACDDAVSMLREAISTSERLIREHLLSLTARIDTSASVDNVIVFNLTAHDREELVEFELWQPFDLGEEYQNAAVYLRTTNGNEIATQRIESSGKIGDDRARFIAKVSVPAFGWTTFGIERNGKYELSGKDEPCPLSYTPAVVIRDDSDTWGHGVRSFTDHLRTFNLQSEQMIENGPLRKAWRISSTGPTSGMEEEYYIEPGSDVIELRVFLDWHEQHRILKLRFPHGCKSPQATYEIPFASIERPIGTQEWPGQSWVNVTERDGSRGLTLVTDSKYSYSVDEQYIYVIVARSPLFAHHTPPHEIHRGERLRYQDQGEQEFRILLIPHNGHWSGDVLPRFESPLVCELESQHSGDLPKTFRGVLRKSNGIHIGAIKLAEDVNGVIVRAVEQAGKTGEESFELPLLKAKWSASFTPFEIKTFAIREGVVTEVDLLERPL
jgi:alpha-mannosidase